ncbi:MAG: hypothetical protein JXR83_20920 [Deltaproteobacteria bacterium]|nr:hypothetical protein [Deltaproteobacteria bacterium]
MKKLIAVGLSCWITLLAACDDCGGETPPPGDASGSDAATADHAAPDVRRDVSTADRAALDAAAGDLTSIDHGGADHAIGDAGVGDGATADATLDSHVADSALADAGTPVTVLASVKVDELGVSQVDNVRVQFVRVDWDVFDGPPICEDGGPGDAAGRDGGGSMGSWRTDPVGEAALLATVTRAASHFAVLVPESPPADHLTFPPDDRCGVNTDTRMAMYQGLVFLDSTSGAAGQFDDSDDILGLGDTVSYAGGSGRGTAMLVYATGSALPFGLSAGWNYLIVGLYDNAPPPEPGDLASDEFAISITNTPHPALSLDGQFTLPAGGVATAAADRRIAFLANRRLGGVSEIIAAPATATTYTLDLPADLGGGNLSEYIVHYGPIAIAAGALVAYADDNSNQLYDIGEAEGSSSRSCPLRDIWFLSEPLPWPWVLITGARLARGYNVVGRSWNESSLQIEPLVNISETDAVDIDIPMDGDVDFTNNDEPVADTGCACGLIPAPYTSGCR